MLNPHPPEDRAHLLRVTGLASSSHTDPSMSSALSVVPAAHVEFQDDVQTSSPDDAKGGVRTHLATRFLRKSASADSGIARRSPTPSAAAQDALPSVGEPNIGSQPDRTETRALSSPPSVMSLSGYLRSKVGRRRGTANTTMTDTEVSAQEDSDFDKSSVPSGTVKERVRARLLSLKSSKAPPPAAASPASQPSDIPSLPARGASTSLSNLKAPNPTNPKLSRKSTVSSLAPEPLPTTTTSRTRSHSVGPPSKGPTSRTSKRLSFGNDVPRPEATRELSIAVLGATGCGKSTFIRKGFRRHDLSAPESRVVAVIGQGKARDVAYTRRTARFSTGFNTDTVLSVDEYNLDDWRIDNDVWPPGLPHVDGVFIVYDESDRSTFADVIRLISGFASLGVPSLVIACKADLEKRVHPGEAALAIDPYSKLIEVSCNSDDGKRRMKKATGWLVKQILSSRYPSQVHNISESDQNVSCIQPQTQTTKRNPTLSVRTHVPQSSVDLASPTSSVHSTTRQSSLNPIKTPSPSSSSKKPLTDSSPMNDLRSSHPALSVSSPYGNGKDSNTHKSVTSSFSFTTKSTDSYVDISLPTNSSYKRISSIVGGATIASNGVGDADKENDKKTFPTPWVTLDELLEKLFFLAISGDDASFISHFFLTYRRFATPRSILLAMQKRLNELRNPANDAVLACFAQMRICNLLEQWMREYPSDFAVPGTQGAFQAVVRHMLSYSHTLSYGRDFMPFLDLLGTLTDEDAAWALKADVNTISDSDTEADSILETNLANLALEELEASQASPPEVGRTSSEPPRSPRSSNRERRSSLPLSAMARIRTPIMTTLLSMEEPTGPSPKEVISRLQRAAAALNNYESQTIANEITRREMELFVRIKPRDWLRHTFISGKKDPRTDTIARFNAHYNDLHEWAVSLILCHDKPRMRARQIEKFAEVAAKLRMLNNYSGLRALITAINQATFPGDEPMEIFKMKVDLHKKYLSSDILLRTTGAHQSYRMALRNTKGPCIPSLEVHTSDLRRAHEGNPDTKPDDPSKINWAKYNMMGRFIETTTSLQQRCMGPTAYKFVENKYLGQLLDVPVMDYDMQQSRISQAQEDETCGTPNSTASFSGGHSKESSVIRRILQW